MLPTEEVWPAEYLASGGEWSCTAPPSWNVCLSATLLGNKDVDWLAHLKEKRASIFMSPDYLEAMKALFVREQSVAAMMEGSAGLEALSGEAREALSDLLAPFLAHRQRACLGESSDRRRAVLATYPPFELHRRPRSLSPTRKQQALIDEIVSLTGELAPGKRLASVETTRFGTRAERRHNQNSLYARNLLNVLRANAAQAHWEIQDGAIGRALTEFETAETLRLRRRLGDQAGQFSLFQFEDDTSLSPRCDRLTISNGRLASANAETVAFRWKD